MHFLEDDEETLCGSPGIPHIPGMIPVGFCCRTCQQRIMISLHQQVRISGGGCVPVIGRLGGFSPSPTLPRWWRESNTIRPDVARGLAPG